jgi:putative alpha-1,2-mannosidase
MSAWYIFSCLGFYPVCPGSNEYVLGSPCVESARIDLGGGKEFVIRAEEFGRDNPYIQSVELNGRPYMKGFLRHEDLASGGTLLFRMGPRPNLGRATADEDLPYSMSGE